MSKNVIAFQGEPGANSHIAAQEVYPDLEPLPCATFEDAFVAVTDGPATLAMIPIENSIAGRVADIHHLLPTSGLHIIGEHFLPIHFQLLATADADLGTIKTVHSHVHALGQCRKIIRKLGLKAVVAGDTADIHVKRALEELAYFSKELHILGVFPAHPFREKIKEPG